MNNRELIEGIRDSFPVVLGYMPLGFAFGVLANEVGLTVFQATLMSILCFTGAGQYIAIGLLSAGGAIITIIAANFLVNLRYLLFATSLVPFIKNIPTTKASLLTYGLTDETYAVAINRYQEKEATASYMAGLNITSHISWISSTFFGAMLGTLITNTDKIGLNFALPAMYICLLVLLIKRRSDVYVALFTAGLCLVIAYFIPGTMTNLSNIIVATLVGATLGMLIRERD
ncbi:AzlC family protein [Candidatus Syntrophocurvum alkaliphilum]|uniref:AzlC family protein n=1 Tax=Candidatus Syntrophocurvum alkaliphilum TaxID=2293317 RepID=A0A6I6D874_9FIRM|nr:AzlC family ABC transporter permease [Candidatus Syntrophocurvum alkaliphilum]QGT99236.1 AzlC family protein [Candidatus Syntrophocurvum alkaliphilum]